MATLGSTAEPLDGSEWFGLNVTNHFAILVTMPAGGPWLITRVGAWLAGKDESCDFKLCVWSPGGSLVASSSTQTAASQSFGLGHNTKYEAAMTAPYEVAGGAQVYIGFARDPQDNVQFGTRTSGSRIQKYSSSWPSSLSGASSDPDSIGAYLVYETANQAPNAPTGLSPTGNAVVDSGTAPTVSGTRSDPDSGDYLTAYQIEVYKDDGTTRVYDSGKISVGGTPTTFSRSVSLPSAHAYYRWRARTWDKEGVAGPYSSLQRFYANAVPGTPSAPNVSSSSTLTPTFSGSFSDSGDTLAAVQVEVVRASDSATMWSSGDLSASGSSWSKAYAGTALAWSTGYKVRNRVKDSHGAYSSWSAYRSWTPVQPAGPDGLSPTGTNPRQSSLTPTLTIGHSAQFQNDEYQVRTQDNGGGTLLKSKTWDGSDYADTTSKARVYDGTALSYGGVYYWRARVELSTGTISEWSDWYPFRINATPNAPTGLTPTGGLVTDDTTPDLRASFSDPDTDQGDTATAIDMELARNDNGAVVWSRTGVTPDGSGASDHLETVGPTGMATLTSVTGTASTNTLSKTAHGLVDGQKVQLSAKTGGTGLSTGTDYYVRDAADNSFKLATTRDGDAIDFTTDLSAATVVPQELGRELTYKWRARFTDDMSRQGPYSAYQVFKVSEAPTAELVEPSEGATVEESTPTLGWSFDSPGGKAQYSYRLRVFDKGPVDDNYTDEVLVWDSGETISDATERDIPFGVLEDGHDYAWEVTVKDTDLLAYVLI